MRIEFDRDQRVYYGATVDADFFFCTKLQKLDARGISDGDLQTIIRYIRWGEVIARRIRRAIVADATLHEK